MRISDWSSDVCSSDLRSCHSRQIADPCRWPDRSDFFAQFLGDRAAVIGCADNARTQKNQQFSASRAVAARSKQCAQHGNPAQYGQAIAALAAAVANKAAQCDGLPIRSEEHTSELQSLMRNSYAVFCLKKK